MNRWKIMLGGEVGKFTRRSRLYWAIFITGITLLILLYLLRMMKDIAELDHLMIDEAEEGRKCAALRR